MQHKRRLTITEENWETLTNNRPEGMTQNQWANAVLAFAFNQAQIELAHSSRSYDPKLRTK